MTSRLKGAILLSILLLASAEEDAVERNSKHFSLFSVVTFKNEECSSESTFSGGAVTGTCYTSTECSDKSGTTSGNCASGFGVCCVFISATGASAAISENRTYLQNPLYPAVETGIAGTSSTTITYTINKCASDICQVRLDFVNFVIAGPANTQESGGSTTGYTNCNDFLVSTMSGGFAVPTLCGVLTNEHIYMDLGALSTDTASLALTLAATGTITTAVAMRSWRVKVSQIPCWADYRAPEGCHRYITSQTGQVASYNFGYGPSTTGGANVLNAGRDIMGQDLRTCFRREKGTCCMLFQVCTQFDGIDLTVAAAGGNAANGLSSIIHQGWSFHVDIVLAAGGATITTMDLGLVDVQCTGDYVEIPDSSIGEMSMGSSVGTSNSRYCGNRLGINTAIHAASSLANHSPVWDCTEPFEVNYHSNILNDELGTTYTAGNDGASDVIRGFCLDYTQVQC